MPIAAVRPDPAEISARTPPDRNRYADLLRLASLLVVVAGHWLMAGVTVGADGGLHGQNVLVAQPWTRWLTWGLQVMPVFFFVGGYANLTGWRAARQRGTGYVDWVRARAGRLLIPTLPLVALWVPLAGILAVAGVPDDVLRLGTGTVMVPLWFLAVYIVIVALTPVTALLHRRYGRWAVVGLVGAAVAVDVGHRAGVPLLGWTNFVWVWAAVHQIGYLWRDGVLTRSDRVPPLLAASGLAALILMTTVGGYPVSMLGVDGAARSNNLPPSSALIAVGVMQVGVALTLRRPVQRWLERPRVWARVAVAGSAAMTVYLWHMTAMVAGLGIAYPLGLLPRTAFDGAWWATRPVWLLGLGLVLMPMVMALRRFERCRSVAPLRTRSSTVAITVAGVLAVCTGLASLILHGVHVPDQPLGVPVAALAVFVAGVASLGALRTAR